MTYKMKGHTLPGIKQKPVTKKPKTEGKEIKVKTDSSKLYGVDLEGYEPPVTEEDKNKTKKVVLKDLRPNDKNIDLDKGKNMPVKKSGFGPRENANVGNMMTRQPEDTAE